MDASDFTDYREFLKAALASKRQTSARLTQSYFAEKSGIQRTYLSHVLAGRAELNSDQLFCLCEVLGLSADIETYLQILLELARCGNARRRQILLERAENWRRSHRQKSEDFLISDTPKAGVAELYYQDPYMPIIHMMLLIDRYRNKTALIGETLQISLARVATIVDCLVQMGIAERQGRELNVKTPHLHLPDTHPLARHHATEMRHLSIHRRMTSDDDRELFFTATFTADCESLTRIRKTLLETIGSVSKMVKKAPSDELAQLNIDLFAIGKDWKV